MTAPTPSQTYPPIPPPHQQQQQQIMPATSSITGKHLKQPINNNGRRPGLKKIADNIPLTARIVASLFTWLLSFVFTVVAFALQNWWDVSGDISMDGSGSVTLGISSLRFCGSTGSESQCQSMSFFYCDSPGSSDANAGCALYRAVGPLMDCALAFSLVSFVLIVVTTAVRNIIILPMITAVVILLQVLMLFLSSTIAAAFYDSKMLTKIAFNDFKGAQVRLGPAFYLAPVALLFAVILAPTVFLLFDPEAKGLSGLMQSPAAPMMMVPANQPMMMQQPQVLYVPPGQLPPAGVMMPMQSQQMQPMMMQSQQMQPMMMPGQTQLGMVQQPQMYAPAPQSSPQMMPQQQYVQQSSPQMMPQQQLYVQQPSPQMMPQQPQSQYVQQYSPTLIAPPRQVQQNSPIMAPQRNYQQ